MDHGGYRICTELALKELITQLIPLRVIKVILVYRAAIDYKLSLVIKLITTTLIVMIRSIKVIYLTNRMLPEQMNTLTKTVFALVVTLNFHILVVLFKILHTI